MAAVMDIGVTPKPRMNAARIASMSFGFFGIQIAFALQAANVSRIFQTLGASVDSLPILWVAGPLTGLIVQPIVGYISDRTWNRFGRRRPYFVAGALASSLALIALPNASVLWLAVVCFWLLDVSINVSMEPFRAFVGDMLPESQRTAGYAAQAIFIGFGALLASAAPFVLTNMFGIAGVAAEGVVPDGVKLAFYLGAAALTISVLWTVLSTREYTPAELRSFAPVAQRERIDAAVATVPPPAQSLRSAVLWTVVGAALLFAAFRFGFDNGIKLLGACVAAFGLVHLIQVLLAATGRAVNPIGETLADLAAMPQEMRRLAIIQFFSWSGLFVMWIYATPVVAQHHFGATDTGSAAYNRAGDWVGILFAVYNAVSAVYAFALPALGERLGRHRLHALNLCAGAAGLASFYLVRDPNVLLFAMVGIGMAWASVLTVPYALLCGALPYEKLGIYMGLFNFFIVIPQLAVSGVMGSIVRRVWPGDPAGVMLLAGGFLAVAALVSCSRGRE